MLRGLHPSVLGDRPGERSPYFGHADIFGCFYETHPMSDDFPLRPFLPADAMALRDLFAQSIEELTADDYDEDQRLAWAASAEDAADFRARLGSMLTLVVNLDGEYLGFGSLKDNKTIEMLYVHPDFAGEGVGTAIADALERIAHARGAEAITVDASDTAVPFFERRGYTAMQRNSVPRDDQWLSNTTMVKPFKASTAKASAPAKPS
jgi:putative acetyltransferase